MSKEMISSKQNRKLYQWQESCIRSWFSAGFHGIAKVVTGAGKTLMALTAASRLEELLASKADASQLRIKIIVPKAFMVSQWKAAIENSIGNLGIFAGDIGVHYGARKDSPNHRCMIYVVNSARDCLTRHICDDLHKGRSILIIADECHHLSSNENRRCFDYQNIKELDLSHCYTLGLSATPETINFDDVSSKTIGPVFFTYSFSQAIADHVVNSCILYQIALELDSDARDKYERLSFSLTKTTAKLLEAYPPLRKASGESFLNTIIKLAGTEDDEIAKLANRFLHISRERMAILVLNQDRIQAVMNLVSTLNRSNRILIYTERIEQCDKLSSTMNHFFPGQVSRYHSAMPAEARTFNLNEFITGRTRILVCCRALDEGLDIPSVDVGIILSCTSQERQRIQRLGRIIRRKEGKTISAIYYFYFEQTIERSTMIHESDGEGIREYFLTYDKAADQFIFPEFEDALYLLQSQLSKTHPDAIATLQPYLEEGRLRPDWLLPPPMLKSTSEDQSIPLASRNYLKAMYLLSSLRP